MKTVDFSTYKFRCSGLKHLMVKSRSKTDPISETTKVYLRDIWIDQVLGRQRVITSAAMEKGTAVESDSMELFQEVSGQTFFKNNTHYENEFIKGTPDIVDAAGKTIKDTKSNWDIWTFAGVTEEKARADYYYQMLGYMWLAGGTEPAGWSADLLYCLVNTPEHIMMSEWRKLAWSMDETEAEAIVRNNHTVDDIPAPMRLKKYHFDYSQEDVDFLIGQIDHAREYLGGLSL